MIESVGGPRACDKSSTPELGLYSGVRCLCAVPPLSLRARVLRLRRKAEQGVLQVAGRGVGQDGVRASAPIVTTEMSQCLRK